ncbi:MAG: hypothetical protein ACK6BZ_01530 [Candidatus Kapaibacterium sp.]
MFGLLLGGVGDLFGREPGIMSRVDLGNVSVVRALDVWKLYVGTRYVDSAVYDGWYDPFGDRFTEDMYDCWLPKGVSGTVDLYSVVLSAEPEDDYVVLRTLWYRRVAGDLYPATIAITRTYVLLGSDGVARLCNPVVMAMRGMKQRSVGGLSYVIDKDYKLNYAAAERMVDYCDSLSALYDVEDIRESYFVIARSRDELASLCGVEYFASPPIGLAYPKSRLMLSSLGNEWYPHEMAHLVFRQFSGSHPFLFEGLAVFVGGSINDSYKELIQKAGQELRQRKVQPELKEIMGNPVAESLLYYAIAGLIIHGMYEAKGASGVKKLLTDVTASTTIEEVIYVIDKKYDRANYSISNSWYNTLLMYADKYSNQ